jgi:hypothetical protein
MGFELDGKLTIDYSELDRMRDELAQRTEAVDAQAAVDVDTDRAEDKLDTLAAKADDLTDSLSRTTRIDVDTGTAERQLSTMTDSWQNRWEKAIDEVSTGLSNMATGQKATTGIFGGLMSTKTAAMAGAGMAVGGFAIASVTANSALEAAKAQALMERSTKQVFGTAAGTYEAEARKMADSTGYMTTALERAQLNIQKARTATGLVDLKDKSGQALNAGAVNPLVGRVADMAATSGLSEYADNVEAVSEAVARGLMGTSNALLDFGIRLDEAYVLSLSVNRGFKDMGEAITPAQLAQARYNAIMEQTNAINGKAAETQDDAARSLQKWHQSMQSAKASVGEVLLPIAKGIADFVANIPDPLLKAGVWAGIFAGLAAGMGGLIIGFAALKKALQDLGITATQTAVQVEGAAMAEKARGGGLGIPTGTGGGVRGLLDGIKGLAGKIGYAGGGLSAGAGYAGVGGLAAGVAGGAVLALPAAVGAGLLMKYGSNMQKNAESELDAATERYLMNAVRVAKLTGASIPAEAAAQAARQGIYVPPGLQPGDSFPAISITINDRTDGGISVDQSSYSEPNF